LLTEDDKFEGIAHSAFLGVDRELLEAFEFIISSGITPSRLDKIKCFMDINFSILFGMDPFNAFKDKYLMRSWILDPSEVVVQRM
jgi:hypothetical protein